jgi:hypothetical protein
VSRSVPDGMALGEESSERTSKDVSLSDTRLRIGA